MKKRNLLHAAAAMLIAVNILSLTACSQNVSAAAASASSSVTVTDQTTVYGKVTAIDKDKVTIALGTMDQTGANGNPPQGEPGKKGGKSADTASGSGTDSSASKGNPPAKPDKNGGTSGTASGSAENAPQGNPPQGGGRGADLTLTGATKTITISDTSILKKQSMRRPEDKSSTSSGSTASLTDITVGSVLKVTYTASSEKLVSVEIMGNMGGKQGSSSSASK